ncbi:hypothetical protein [Ruminococcus sp.]
MIDCSRTENYFAEKQRMTKVRSGAYYICKLDCADCLLSAKNNGTGVTCTGLESIYPEKAIAIVQKWSDEHPQKTYLSEFLKHYPDAPLGDGGTPEICLRKLGLTDIKTCRVGGCVECWNQPIEESEK